MKKSITPIEFNSRRVSGQELTILDVRRKDDFDKNPVTIAGAQWRDPAGIDQWLPAIPPGKEVIVYCVRGGPVSQSVQQKLADHGYSAQFIEGGLEAMQKEKDK